VEEGLKYVCKISGIGNTLQGYIRGLFEWGVKLEYVCTSLRTSSKNRRGANLGTPSFWNRSRPGGGYSYTGGDNTTTTTKLGPSVVQVRRDDNTWGTFRVESENTQGAKLDQQLGDRPRRSRP